MDTDPELRQLLQNLGAAINDSLSDSERIAEAIGEVKRVGYEVFLVLEATIGLNKREDVAGEQTVQPAAIPEPGSPQSPFDQTGQVKFTSRDTGFLRSLKIKTD